MKLVNIGFGNIVSRDKTVAIVSTDSAPIKRMIQKAREEGTLIDATQGRKTKSLIITSGTFLITSALQPETLMQRFNDTEGGSEDESGR